MATDGPTPAPCPRDIFEHGEPVIILDARSNACERFVRAVAEMANARVDWHYSGGRAQVLFLGDAEARKRVGVALDALLPKLEGRVLSRCADGEELYRRRAP